MSKKEFIDRLKRPHCEKHQWERLVVATRGKSKGELFCRECFTEFASEVPYEMIGPDGRLY